MRHLYRLMKITFVVTVIFDLTIIFLLLFGCSTPKKIQTLSNENQKSNETVTESITVNSEGKTETQTASGVESNTYTIEFFNPNEINDFDKLIAIMRERNEPYSNMGIVKSITGNQSKSNELKTVLGEVNTKSVSAKSIETSITKDTKINNIEQPAPDPMRWRYIFWICLTVLISLLILYFLLKKSQILKYITTFLSKMIGVS